LRATAVPDSVGRTLALAEAGVSVTDDAASRSAHAAGWLPDPASD